MTLKPRIQKAKMLEVPRRLLWEKGYMATSMRDIGLSYGGADPPISIISSLTRNRSSLRSFVKRWNRSFNPSRIWKMWNGPALWSS
jgi:hypothetical protein